MDAFIFFFTFNSTYFLYRGSFVCLINLFEKSGQHGILVYDNQEVIHVYEIAVAYFQSTIINQWTVGSFPSRFI